MSTSGATTGDSASEAREPAPPREEIRLPGPAYAPAMVAAGITIALVGVVHTFFITALGAIVFLVPTIRWIRDAREEASELPLER